MKYETRLIWVLWITFGFVFFDRNAVNFLMPFITTDLNFSNSQIGLIASALSLTWAIAGWAADHYSLRVTMFMEAGCALFAAALGVFLTETAPARLARQAAPALAS